MACHRCARQHRPPHQTKISGLVTDYLNNWKGVGIVALLAALYSGAGWMGNLKNAVRAQWRPDFDLQEAQGNIVKKTAVNLVLLLGLIVLIAITFALASLSTALTGTVLDALGLSHIGWLRPVLHFVPIIFSIGAGWLLFMYLYTVLPEDREPWPIVRRGALIGAVGLGVLQYGTGLLFAAFQNNKAAQLFGPVIVLMLFFNVFAQLILFIAAWIATARHEAIAVPEEKVRFALTPESERDADSGSDAEHGEPVMVPQKIAARSVQVGLGAGYVTGAATGVGLGATLAWLVSKTVRGHRGSSCAAETYPCEAPLSGLAAVGAGWPMPLSSSPYQSAVMSNGLPPLIRSNSIARSSSPRSSSCPITPGSPRSAESTAKSVIDLINSRSRSLAAAEREKYPDFCTITFCASSRSANLLANQAPGLTLSILT